MYWCLLVLQYSVSLLSSRLSGIWCSWEKCPAYGDQRCIATAILNETLSLVYHTVNGKKSFTMLQVGTVKFRDVTNIHYNSGSETHGEGYTLLSWGVHIVLIGWWQDKYASFVWNHLCEYSELVYPGTNPFFRANCDNFFSLIFSVRVLVEIFKNHRKQNFP